MSKLKKWIITLIVLAILAGAGAGGLMVIKQNNIKYVQVAKVSELLEEAYWGDEGITFDGSVTSNLSQTITIPATATNDIYLDEIYVSEGDEVKEGDIIVTFDTTLADMKLNILNMRLMQYQLQYNEAATRLADLRNGAALNPEIDFGGTSSITGFDDSPELVDTDSDDDDEDDFALLTLPQRGYLALARPFVLAFEAIFADGAEEIGDSLAVNEFDDDEDEDDDDSSFDDEDEGDGFSSESVFFHGEDEDDSFDESDGMANYRIQDEDGEIDTSPVLDEDENGDAVGEDEAEVGADRTEVPIGKPSELTSGEVDVMGGLFDGSGNGTKGNHVPWLTPAPTLDGNAGWGDGTAFFSEEQYLRVIDWDSIPYGGLGTRDDPFVYLCTCAKGRVTVTGGFLNRMAGYNTQGTILENPEGYWYQLEWHKYDTIDDYTDRKKSCTGYYLIDGKTLTRSVDPSARTDFLLDDASVYKEEEEDDPGLDDFDFDDTDLDDDTDFDDDDDDEIKLDRNEVIAYWEKRVRSLSLTMRKQELQVDKQKKIASKKAIYARMDGVVAKVASNSAGARQIQIKSSEGYIVTASLSELYLPDVTPGTLLSCQDYSAGGTFTAKVTDVSVYPTTSNSYYFYQNPNTSFYTLTASIEDAKGVRYADNDYLSISLLDPKEEEDNIIINRAFVRSENGSHYVYKDVNGVIRKHYVKVSGFVNGGYSVQLESGLKTSDRIAFPYGTDLAEGLPTREVSGDTILGY